MSADGAELDPNTEDEDTTPVDDGEDVNPDVAPEPKPSRKEARAARAAEHRELEELRAYRKQNDEERAADRAAIAELRGYVAAQAQRQQQEAPDPVVERSRQLQKEARQHLLNAQGSKSPEVAEAEFEKFQEKTAEVGALRGYAMARNEMAQQEASRPDPESARGAATLQAEHNWLGQHAAATAAAAAMERELQQKQGGRTPTLAQSRAILAEVAKTYKLGGQSSGGNRAAYSGVPSREGGKNSGGGEAVTFNHKALPEFAKKLAQGAYPGDEAPVAYKKWAAAMNKVGRDDD
jgi:hypothetical protein